ncbi:MAG: hypothetical protein HPY52_16165 [Firmicutes bacterium]|nr:hypothetical protein [Bacillota bacterium]
MELTEEFRKRFVRRFQGKDFIVYSGLLELAREKGLRRLEVEIVQIPSPENGNYAVCSATLEGEDGSIYREVGDASPDNVNKNIAPHILRMAATRAKARALRDFTGVDMVSFEEMGEIEDDYDEAAPIKQGGDSEPSRREGRSGRSDRATLPLCGHCGAEITQSVYNFSMRKFGRPLCMACQRKAAAG